MIFYQILSCRVYTFCLCAQAAAFALWTIHQTERLRVKCRPPWRSEVIKHRGPSWVTRTDQGWWLWPHQILQAGVRRWEERNRWQEEVLRWRRPSRQATLIVIIPPKLHIISKIRLELWSKRVALKNLTSWFTSPPPFIFHDRSLPTHAATTYRGLHPIRAADWDAKSASHPPPLLPLFTSLRPSLLPSISPGIRSDWR